MMEELEKHLYVIWLYMAAINTPACVRKDEIDFARRIVAKGR